MKIPIDNIILGSGLGDCTNVEGSLNITTRNIYFENLQPNCFYDFFLYMSNDIKEYDEDVFLKISKNTFNYLIITGELVTGAAVLFVILVFIFVKICCSAKHISQKHKFYHYNKIGA